MRRCCVLHVARRPRCTLQAARCMVCVACCALHVACCALHVACCALHVACCTCRMLHCCMRYAVYVTGSTVHAACCTSACTRARCAVGRSAAQRSLGTCSPQLGPAGRRRAGARTRHAGTNKPRRRRLRTAPAPRRVWCTPAPARGRTARRDGSQYNTARPSAARCVAPQRNTLQHIATRGGPCFGASCHCPEERRRARVRRM
jgi:hypothetical protein